MKQKILITINALRSGGAERVVSVLLEHLKNDFDIHLAVYTGGANYNIPKEVTVFDMQQPFEENEMIRLAKIPYLAWKLNRYAKKNNIPVSIAFLNRACYLNAMMRSLWGYKGKLIMCQRTHLTSILKDTGKLYSALSSFLIKYSFKRADLILTNSRSMKEDLEKNFNVRKPMRVIYNPIDTDIIQSKSKEALQANTINHSFFNFINVGGFRKEKNQTLLVEAMSLLKDLECKLIFCGDGIFREQVKQQVISLQLEDKVIFYDFDSNPFKYISRSGCLVLSSDLEGFPNVLLEALACGCPVISTDCDSGPRELLAPGTDYNYHVSNNYEEGEYGLLVPVKDPVVLAAAMRRMLEDETLRNQYRSKGLTRAQQFDVDAVILSFREVFLV